MRTKRLWFWKRSRVSVALEWKPADLWIGVYLHRSSFLGATLLSPAVPGWDVWVCLLPMLPLHVCWVEKGGD